MCSEYLRSKAESSVGGKGKLHHSKKLQHCLLTYSIQTEDSQEVPDRQRAQLRPRVRAGRLEAVGGVGHLVPHVLLQQPEFVQPINPGGGRLVNAYLCLNIRRNTEYLSQDIKRPHFGKGFLHLNLIRHWRVSFHIMAVSFFL